MSLHKLVILNNLEVLTYKIKKDIIKKKPLTIIFYHRLEMYFSENVLIEHTRVVFTIVDVTQLCFQKC